MKALRKAYRLSGVNDGSIKEPTSWYDLRILAYLVRGVPYKVACENAEELMDVENPADLDQEVTKADKENFFDNVRDIFTAGSAKGALYEARDLVEDITGARGGY
jgi:hypothetical protein